MIDKVLKLFDKLSIQGKFMYNAVDQHGLQVGIKNMLLSCVVLMHACELIHFHSFWYTYQS